MSIPKKKWISFEEMYIDLKNDSQFKNSLKETTEDSIFKVIKEIEVAKTSRDFFNCTCKLSSIFEALDQKLTHEIYIKTNIYVLVLNAVFRNNKFIDVIYDVIGKNKKISELKKGEVDFSQLVFLNSALSLAFFGIALDHQIINKKSIEFLRKNIIDLLKNILKQKKGLNNDFVKICFFLEKTAWDNRLHYNENFDSKFPEKLDDRFLFTNLKTSRAFAGIALTSLVIRPAIEDRFKNIISNIGSEKFSITFALDLIYKISNELDEKINHYYRNTPKDITDFFDVFIQSNERNLLFCFKKFCFGFHYQGQEKKFSEIIFNKLNTIPKLRNEFAEYIKVNFKAFNDEITEDDGWTNKLFLISIKTFAILEEVRRAQDLRWSLRVAVRELHQWTTEIHEVLNKYYIEDDWDKIKDFIQQENERIEWKASFFTPLEQVFTDNESEKLIQARIFGKIIKVILAMLNTDGGALIVGVVENPNAIKRIEMKESILIKNGISFFDIGYEFKKQNKTLDQVRMQILEELRKITDSSVEQFNNLIEFNPLTLRSDNGVCSIIQILIKKSEKNFFNVKKENNLIWLSLTKRAHGQNVDVDIREYI